MKYFKNLSLSVGLLCITTLTYADNSQMNTTLERINQLLNQVNPLVNLAQSQEDKDARVKFQFDALRSDIARIQAGISQAINRPTIQPRVVEPLAGDYLSTQNDAGGDSS